MKTKIRYNHAVNFGNFDIDALEAYLPREIEIEQNEEFEFLEVDLKMVRFQTHVDIDEESGTVLYTDLTFTIESQNIELHDVNNIYKHDELLVEDMLFICYNYVHEQITRILNEQFSNMVDSIKGNQDNEIEKQKTEEFIRKHF